MTGRCSIKGINQAGIQWVAGGRCPFLFLRPHSSSHMLLHILSVLAGQLFFAVHAFCTVDQHRANTRLIYGFIFVKANLWLKEYLLIFHLFLLGVCNSLFLYGTIVTAIFWNTKQTTCFFQVFKRLSKLLKLLTYQVCTSHCITANIRLYYFLPIIMSPGVLSVIVYPLW